MTPEERLTKLEILMNGLLNAGEADPSMVITLGLLITKTSTKSAGSENQAVDEGGSATFDVLGPPDRWGKIGTGFAPLWDE